MQEEDWGQYTQAPWMTGGAWKDTNVSINTKRNKVKKQPPHVSTLENAMSPQTEQKRFQTEVELADLRLDLRRWNFARSWRNTASSSPADEAALISPRTRSHKDVEGPASHSQGKAFTMADGQAEKRHRAEDETFPSSHRLNNTITQPDQPLDRQLVGQYLDKCIAVAESQIAGARDKSKKKKAVEEIERLVEKVIMTQADRK